MTDRKKLREAAETFNRIINAVESRCMATDGPVTPTLKEMEEGELRDLWLATQTILSLLDDLDRPVGEVVAYNRIISIVSDCVERIRKSGESHAMLAKWISEGINAAPSPAIGRETDMTAVSVRDEETGAIHWQCTERDGRGEVSDEAVVTLAADTFPVGTRIEIIEPGAQP